MGEGFLARIDPVVACKHIAGSFIDVDAGA
jgi:hypothetical protein